MPRELEGPTSGAGGGGGEAPSGAGSSAEPTLECPNWNALWCMLMGQTAGKAPGACVALPIRELNFRWDVNMAWELAEGLWGEEICLDRQRRTEIRKKGESFWDISTSGGQNMNPPPAVIQPKKGKFELVPLLKFVNDLSNGMVGQAVCCSLPPFNPCLQAINGERKTKCPIPRCRFLLRKCPPINGITGMLRYAGHCFLALLHLSSFRSS